MRGLDRRSGSLFSYVDLDARVPLFHPLRAMRDLVNASLAALDVSFEALYETGGRPSIPPERLLRATMLQLLYSFRSERQLVERLEYAQALFALLALPDVKSVLSAEHFSVDGTMLKVWASMKSFRAKDGSDEPPTPGRNGERDFKKKKRSNQTHASSTNEDAQLFRKGDGQESRLAYLGHALMENRNGLAGGAQAALATGTAEREAAAALTKDLPEGATLGMDKNYDAEAFVEDLKARKIEPHIAINGSVSKLGKVRKTAVLPEVAASIGNEISMRCRKRIEEKFGWGKIIGGLAQPKVKTASKRSRPSSLSAPSPASGFRKKSRSIEDLRCGHNKTKSRFAPTQESVVNASVAEARDFRSKNRAWLIPVFTASVLNPAAKFSY